MAGCAFCGSKLEIVGNQVGRRDTCPSCERDVHSCRNCRHFDESVAKGCKEPFAEAPKNRDDANFCEYFQVGEGGRIREERMDSVRAAAESLFAKK